MVAKHRFLKAIKKPKFIFIGLIALVLLTVSTVCTINWLDDKPADTNVMPQTTQDRQPANQQTQANPNPAPAPATTLTQSAKSLAVSITGLNTRLRSGVGYEIDVFSSSNLNVAGVCKITFSKQGSTPIVKQINTQPNDGTNSTTCNYAQLAALLKGNTWEYYMEPGTWTVTVEMSGNGLSGSDSGTITVSDRN